jgi:hypothetical protein
MPVRWRGPLILHSALWGALGLAFLYLSVPQVVRGILQYSVGPVDSLHSLDLYLPRVSDSPAASQRLLRTLSLLPKDGRVIIFAREKEESSAFLGMAIAYLVWPRKVELIYCNERAAEERLAAIPPASVSALIFCSIKQPAWLPEGMLCAKGVKVVCPAKL